jgi:Cu/Zn superoxide dismutase
MKSMVIGGLMMTFALAVPHAALAGGAKAVAALESRSGSTVTGKVTFTQHGGKVAMKIVVSGLTPGEHAIHLHEKAATGIPRPRTTASGGMRRSTTATSATL